MDAQPSTHRLFDAMEATWPPTEVTHLDGWTLRRGAGGGSRVSAATGFGDINQAETAMKDLGQNRLFMLRPEDMQLDEELAGRGYKIMDPVVIFLARTQTLAELSVPDLAAIPSTELLARQSEIWAQGGIGPARLAVMARAKGPKSYLLARSSGRAAGAGFVACDGDIAMLHALEICPAFRRAGLGRAMTIAAARWAMQRKTDWISLMCTRANSGAVALYQGLGMTEAGHYHYRVHLGDA